MYRREYLLEHNLIFRKGITYEDLYIILDLLLNTNRIINIDYPFYNHVFREGSILNPGILNSDASWKKIQDNVSVLDHWKEIIDGIEDKTLQKYLYGVFFTEYIRTCNNRGLTGWGFSGVTFPFALSNSFGWKQKVKVMLYEQKTIFRKLIPKHSGSQRLLTIEEYNSILAENKDTPKEG